MNDMFRMLVFFGLITPAFASQTLDALVSAAANFSAAIQQQLATRSWSTLPVQGSLEAGCARLTRQVKLTHYVVPG